MAALGSQSIASSYEQLLHVDRDGGGNTTNLVAVKDGDNGTTFALQLASDNIKVDGTTDLDGQVTINESGADKDFRVEASGAANALFVQGSDGYVGIGTAAPVDLLHIFATDSSAADNTNALMVIEKSAGNALLHFKSANSSDNIGIAWGDVANSQSGMLVYNHTNDVMSFNTAAAERMRIEAGGDIDIGTGDIYFSTAGKGICLGVTSNTDSNTLDDYEEGTFTIGWSGASMSSVGNSTGYYTKIGDTVYFQYYNNGMTIGSASGTATITGLPFTSSSTSEAYATMNLQYANAVDGSSSGGHIGNNSTEASFTDEGAASYATYIDGTGKKLMVSGTYKV